jgi:hypothetical protein
VIGLDLIVEYGRSSTEASSSNGRRAATSMDGSTYPVESGAPVFRSSDNAVVAVVQATRVMRAPPHDVVRGPTLAGPLGPIAGELAIRGVKLLP